MQKLTRPVKLIVIAVHRRTLVPPVRFLGVNDGNYQQR